MWTELGSNDLWDVFFKNCSQNSIPSKTLVAMAMKWIFKQFYKNILLWNHWSNFEIISQEHTLGDPFQKLLSKFWSVHKHGSGEWGLLALYRHEEILKKSSSPKLWVRFWNNFTEMFLWWPFQKLIGKFSSVVKHGPSECGLLSLYRYEWILKKSSCLKPLVRFWNNFIEIFLGWPFSKFVRDILICQ